VSTVAWVLTACPAPIDVKLEPPAAGFQLTTPAFEVPAGTETQRCYFFEVPSDEPVLVHRFEIAQNDGTHHMNVFRVRTLRGLSGAPGESVLEGECWTSSNWSDWPLVVNSQESGGHVNPQDPDSHDGYTNWELPAGVAMRFEPRELLMLQTHYVNATTQKTPLHGKVLVNFHTAAADGVDAQVGTAFATNQSIRICPGETNKLFEATCRIAQADPVTIIAANSHFHSRGTRFAISVFDPSGAVSAPFYETDQWRDPPMSWGLDIPVPANGGIRYRCEYSVPADACGDPDDQCCFTFGGKVEFQEHCNVFAYFYPRTTTDIGCF
jgi:hypothetical protein